MKLKRVFIIFLVFVTTLFAEVKKIDSLLEKVNHATSASEKKSLIEKLKQELADSNKKAREEADAIIKAKEKIPLNTYSDEAITK